MVGSLTRVRYVAALAEAKAVAGVASQEMRRNTGAMLAGQQLGDLISPESAGLRWCARGGHF